MVQREEYGLVLTYRPEGIPTIGRYKQIPIAQLVGTSHFVLLEVTPKRDEQGNLVKMEIGEKVYIGSGKRDKVLHIKRRIKYDELTGEAKAELPIILEKLVKEQEERFVKFLNESIPLSIRAHQLELLPSIGKTICRKILDEREKKPFTSFEDFSERIPGTHPIAHIFRDKILEEIKGEEKHYFFAAPPPKPETEW
jgi:putative nucleotide binding protein